MSTEEDRHSDTNPDEGSNQIMFDTWDSSKSNDQEIDQFIHEAERKSHENEQKKKDEREKAAQEQVANIFRPLGMENVGRIHEGYREMSNPQYPPPYQMNYPWYHPASYYPSMVKEQVENKNGHYGMMNMPPYMHPMMPMHQNMMNQKPATPMNQSSEQNSVIIEDVPQRHSIHYVQGMELILTF
jgi:hypothetical protein